MYNIGDYVVRPNSGICKIEAIENINLGTGEKRCFVLFPIRDGRAKFYVPIDADRSRIRSVMTKDEAQRFLDNFASIEALTILNEKFREQQYKEAVKANEPTALVEVYKNLYARGKLRISQGKKITSTDERYLRQVENALYSELAFSLELEPGDVKTLISEIIER